MKDRDEDISVSSCYQWAQGTLVYTSISSGHISDHSTTSVTLERQIVTERNFQKVIVPSCASECPSLDFLKDQWRGMKSSEASAQSTPSAAQAGQCSLFQARYVYCVKYTYRLYTGAATRRSMRLQLRTGYSSANPRPLSITRTPPCTDWRRSDQAADAAFGL